MDERRHTRGEHENWEVPERIVQHACRSAGENHNSREFVGDGFVGELDRGQGDNANRRSVEAGQESVDWSRERLVDVGYTHGQSIHAQGARETVHQRYEQ